MRIVYSKKFKKKFQKLRSGERKKFEKRVEIFIRNVSDPALNDHALHGKLFRYRSINITGDLRVLYEYTQKDTVLFIDIDTHSNLYA
mgnify:FL=1